jgi:hypothetical protein
MNIHAAMRVASLTVLEIFKLNIPFKTQNHSVYPAVH